MRVLKTSIPETLTLNLGDIVSFPQYGTIYVVHRLDKYAANEFNHINPSYRNVQMYQLYRLDGMKSYRVEPFTYDELVDKVASLNGIVYHKDEYDIILQRRAR